MKYYWINLYIFIAMLFWGKTQGYAQEKHIGISFTNINASSSDSDIWRISKSDSVYTKTNYNTTGLNLGLVYINESYDFRLLFRHQNRTYSNNILQAFDLNEVIKSKSKDILTSIGFSFSKMYNINLNKRFKLHFGPNGQIHYLFNQQATETTEIIDKSFNHSYNLVEKNYKNTLSYQLGLQMSLSYRLKRFKLAMDLFSGLSFYSFSVNKKSMEYKNNVLKNEKEEITKFNYLEYSNQIIHLTVLYNI